MNVRLTSEQLQALDAEIAPCVIDPRTNVNYILVAAAEYEALKEQLAEARQELAGQRTNPRLRVYNSL
jgi:hypothetical protein